ncbi:MAG: NADH-quinone oxidoreductase subunit NuoG [Pseudomonadota bacterium]
MSETAAPQKADTVEIEIDGITMEAPKGSMIIEAADKVGIAIPRFCYHRKLSIAANCRMCLVDVEKAPKPLPACATPVMDGMKVYTQSKRAQSSQQNVMEFLLINHPLDCPICDQGGECELQDVSMGFGRSASRFTERKRVVKDEDLGSLISTEMTRCIHCTRCVRFLDEIAGTNELGGMGRGEKTFISTFIERSVDSELSGNIIDLCPVGALTNKPFRFSARAWELRARPAISNFDSVGANLHYHQRRGRILRAVPRDNDQVNESWLADRDRWGFHGLQDDDRAQVPQQRIDGTWQEISWEQALDAAGAALKTEQKGFLLSPRASNEELYLAQKLARGLGCHNIDHRLRERDLSDQAHLPDAPSLGRPLSELSQAGAVLLVASNVHHEQPLVGHQVRQAWRAQAPVYCLASRRYVKHFEPAVERLLRPSQLAAELAAVASALGASPAGALRDLVAAAQPDAQAEQIAAGLKDAANPAVLLGHAGVLAPDASTLRALARLIAEAAGGTYGEPPLGANGAGAWLLGAVPHRDAQGSATDGGRTAREMLAGGLDTMVVYDFEPMLDCAEGAAATSALTRCSQVIYIGPFVTPEVQQYADLILPLAPLPECEGSLTNLNGHVQGSAVAAKPAGEARPGWKILKALADRVALDGFDFVNFAQVHEEVLDVLKTRQARDYATPESLSAFPAGEGSEVLTEVPVYAGDAVQRRSFHLQRTAHGDDGSLCFPADDLPASEEPVTVATAAGQATLGARVDDDLAPGTVRLAAGTVPGAELGNVSHLTIAAGDSDE